MKTSLPKFRNLTAVMLLMAATHPASAASYFWSQATPGANNWISTGNWTPTGSPSAADTAIFGLTGTVGDNVTVNSVVSANTSVSTLQYTNSGSGVWHVTQIPSTVKLTVTNNLTVGGLTAPAGPSVVAMNGGGTLQVTGNTLSVGQGNTGSAVSGNTLDLSGLSTFVYSASSGTVSLGTGNRSAANVLMAAASNSITAATVNFNTTSSSSTAAGTITLGAGTNLINAGAINIGANRNNCTVQFAASTTAGLRLRGLGGTDSDLATMTVGNHNNSGGSGSAATGTLSFYGSLVDMKLGTLTVGRDSNSTATGANTGTGTISFDTGTVSATNILMAATTTANVNSVARGTVNVGSNSGVPAVLTVGSSGISLVNQASSSSPGNTGNLNVNGGTVNCAGNIIKTTVAGTANVTLTSGSTLSMTGGGASLIGSAVVPIDNFGLSDATLSLPVVSSQASAIVTTLTPGGTTNLINVLSMPSVASYPAQFQLIAYTSLGGTFNFGLGTLPGTYQGYISNNTSSVDLVITGSALRTDTWNGNVSGNWDTSTLNWRYSGGAVGYQQGDFVDFDDTLSGTPNVTLTLNVAPGAIGFNNSSHTYVLSGTNKITGVTGLNKQGSGSVRLSESGGDDFGGGITVNNGTLILDNPNSAISGGLAVNGGTAQIGNNDANGALPAGPVAVNGSGVLAFNRTDSVTVATPITGTGSLAQGGSGTVTLSGVNAYTGDTVVSSGTLALSGSGTISNSTAVSVNNATFDVSALSQPTTLNSLTLSGASISLAPNGSSPNIACTSLDFGATANHINVVSLPPMASYPVTFTLIQSAVAASGAFNVAVGTLPSATPPYAANLTQSADQTAVLLTVASGPIGVRSGVFWTGADVPNLNTNWSDRLNWQMPGAPGSGDNVIFTPTGAQTASALSTPGGGASALIGDNINNIVDANTTISSLTFTNVNGSYHNTLVKDGLTLGMTNTLTAGSGSADFGSGATAFVTIAGPNGTLNVSNTSGTLYVGLGSATGGAHQATLDLSALGTFNAAISRILVGVGSSSCGIPVGRPCGTLYLAQTNAITASLAVSGTETSTTGASAVAFGVGDANGNGSGTTYLYLGQANTIFADAVCTARQKETAQMLFNPAFTRPAASFRGRDGVSAVGIWSLADGVVNAGTSGSTGVNDFSGGTVNALVTTMYVGRAANTATGSGSSIGTLTFDDGVINVGTLYDGYEPASGAKIGVGTVNVCSNATAGAGATLVVTGNLNLGFAAGGAGAGSSSGTLNLTNGTVKAFNIVPGANSTINVAGGWLVLTNPLGNASAPLGTLILASLGTPDNSATLLSLPVRTNSAGITVTTLNLDGLDTTTNIINIESVGPVGTVPVELPLIQYGSMNLLSGSTFNVGLGTLPSGYAGHLVNDTANNAIALMLTAALHPQPRITAIGLQSGTNLTLSGVNGFANNTYSVVVSTNVALPLADWTSVGTGVFGPDGSFSFAGTVSAVQQQQFFSVRAP